MSRQLIQSCFPKLNNCNYTVTSPATDDYNCIAWAARDNSSWWEPDPFNGYYWPPGVPRAYTIDSYIKAYESLGFFQCDNYDYEQGFEKIVIYVNSGMPSHAARQLGPGQWTSKLGKLEDIEHPSLQCIEGTSSDEYGSVTVVMKRLITT